jgi:TolA-binding protein
MKNMIKILLSLVLMAGMALVDAEAASKRAGGRKKAAASTEATAPASPAVAAAPDTTDVDITAMKARIETLEKDLKEIQEQKKVNAAVKAALKTQCEAQCKTKHVFLGIPIKDKIDKCMIAC